MDQIDQSLLKMLQKDAKVDVKYMAERLNMTKTPIYERIKRLERSGIISKYVAVLDRKKLSASMVVFCQVSLDNQKIEKIEQFKNAVAKIPEVMECYLMGGASDFLLKLIVADLDAYHQFSSGKLAGLPNVSQIQSSFVLDEVKRSTVLPV
ncbi:MAG: DNA-binding Lrp family transcriptional regulator [Parvicellaceae bacterium]|jgi:DNA-binding Lrp family transcriptional regulator